MDWTTLATRLFGPDHGIRADGDFLVGSVSFDGAPIELIGTTNHAPIGVRLALAQAQVVLDTMRRHPGRPILMLIDTQGQQLRRHDELLGINRAMAHLGLCIDLARRRGHRVLGVVGSGNLEVLLEPDEPPQCRIHVETSARGFGTIWSAVLADSGGVRLHEANAGLIAVSEVMRALLDVRAAGIPVIVLIGSANGCFGGMGIVARCADWIVMSDVGRLAMSGPEGIEA